MWLYTLLGLIAVVILLLFRTSIKQMTKAIETLTPNISTPELESMTPGLDEPLYRISPV
jgi:hypothetical protein